jgi:hypothetical protein
MSFEGGEVPFNTLPKKLTSTTLKIWQRLAAAAAGMESV